MSILQPKQIFFSLHTPTIIFFTPSEKKTIKILSKPPFLYLFSSFIFSHTLYFFSFIHLQSLRHASFSVTQKPAVIYFFVQSILQVRTERKKNNVGEEGRRQREERG